MLEHTAVLAGILLAGCTDDPKEPSQLALPGSAYYPENLDADSAGTLYVGSLGTGQVVAIADGSTDATPVIARADVTAVTGVAVHADELWICSVDTTFQHPTALRTFGLDGTPHDTFTLAADQFCNDVAFDAAGNAYVADSFGGRISRLTAGGSTFDTLAMDAAFSPVAMGAFGLDGIAVKDGDVFVNTNDTGELFRVSLASGAITPITVTPALDHPDGMRLADDGTLIVVEGVGRLTRVTLAGDTATAEPLATDLDQPTGVALARGAAWVSQGQLGRLFAQPPQPAILPFLVKKVAL